MDATCCSGDGRYVWRLPLAKRSWIASTTHASWPRRQGMPTSHPRQDVPASRCLEIPDDIDARFRRGSGQASGSTSKKAVSTACLSATRALAPPLSATCAVSSSSRDGAEFGFPDDIDALFHGNPKVRIDAAGVMIVGDRGLGSDEAGSCVDRVTPSNKETEDPPAEAEDSSAAVAAPSTSAPPPKVVRTRQGASRAALAPPPRSISSARAMAEDEEEPSILEFGSAKRLKAATFASNPGKRGAEVSAAVAARDASAPATASKSFGAASDLCSGDERGAQHLRVGASSSDTAVSTAGRRQPFFGARRAGGSSDASSSSWLWIGSGALAAAAS
eukprot:TRINITY_DN48100_c0_g1_i1.p1 TRINITY_DN48100_c0_g1~~TRINITY_DN48100_c0_g1_i1.p1  ORF type:complete len:353 (+),score=58.13 TRINITY_DN48100_c0_g1_i1:64-1059(+)